MLLETILWFVLVAIAISVVLLTFMCVGYLIHERREKKRKDDIVRRAKELAQESKDRGDGGSE